MIDALFGLLGIDDVTLRWVLIGSMLIGGTGGLLGTFAVLRKRSLMGDALAHAALPGIGIAFLLTGTKSLGALLIGATISGTIGVLLIQAVVNHSRIKSDAALGIVLSVFYGFGIVIMTYIQNTASGNQSGLDTFLFGQAAAMVRSDILIMSGLAVIILLAVLLFYKEFKCLIFDPQFLTASGFPAERVDLVLMGLIVLTVMVGLQAVGVVLIAAMLITPAVAARFWTNRLHFMLGLSMVFGGLAGAGGTYMSAMAPQIPTGPVMVLVATGFFLLSATFAPTKGLVARWRRRLHNRRRERKQHFLRAFFEEQEGTGNTTCTLECISERMEESQWTIEREARRLERAGLVNRENGEVSLTDKGWDEARFVVKSHRLWEHYLVYRNKLQLDHVDRPADEVEHILTPEILERLESVLADEGIDMEQITNIHRTKSGFKHQRLEE